MDLGECPKIHDLALRADYEKASKTRDYYYDIDVSRDNFLFFISALDFRNFTNAKNVECKVQGGTSYFMLFNLSLQVVEVKLCIKICYLSAKSRVTEKSKNWQ